MEQFALTSESRRLDEVDAAMRTLNVAVASVIFAASLLFVERLGWAFVVFASLTLMCWIVRLSPLGRLASVRVWSIAQMALMTGSVLGGAVLSGGADSPVVFFFGLIALFGNAMFSHLRRCVALGLGSMVLLAGIDFGMGRSVDVFVFLCAFVICGYLPFFVERMIHLEQMQRRRAVVDQLTGCLNRHALEARSIELEEQGKRTGAELSVVVFDLDHFKEVNDRHGHGVGDRVLAHIAYEARKHLRRFELVYRLGGEEFAVLLPGADISTASAIADTIRRSIESEPMDGIEITASFGVACQAAPFDVHATIDIADRRLYEAKRRGRNCVVDSDVDQQRESVAV